jgi:hypothetical protein
VAALGGSPVAVLVLHDPAGTAADTERVAVEHATTVLTMEIARLQHLAQGEARTRINLVLDLVGDAGAEYATLLNRAQASATTWSSRTGSSWSKPPGPTATTTSTCFSTPSAGRPGPPEWGRCWRHGCTT